MSFIDGKVGKIDRIVALDPDPDSISPEYNRKPENLPFQKFHNIRPNLSE